MVKRFSGTKIVQRKLWIEVSKLELDRKYNNPSLEKKRREAGKLWVADKILRKKKERPGNELTGFPDSLKCLCKKTSFHENIKEYQPRLNLLIKATAFWIRKPEDYIVKTHNTERQFSGLVRHLLCKYYVPVFMDEAWYNNAGLDQKHYREWFIHIGSGFNIRKAQNLPIPLTKMQAHHFIQSPDNYTIKQSFRYGQVMGLQGGTPDRKSVV